MAAEQTREEQEVRIPFYYERFLEERDRRFSSEIARLETSIQHNGQRIDELRADNARQHQELRTDIARLEAKIDSLRTEMEAKIDGSRTEMEAKIDGLRTEMEAKIDSYFRWTLGLLLPIILGVVALLIQNLFLMK